MPEGDPMEPRTSVTGSWTLPPEATPPESSLPDPTTVKIYVVDDDENVVRVVSRFLSSRGYDVETFLDPIVARARIEAQPPGLLLTDKDMPTVDGLELALTAMETDPDTAVLVLTGSPDVESATESLRMGIVEYLLKPADLQRIEEAVSRALWHRGSRIYRRTMERWMREELERQARKAAERAEEVEAVTMGAIAALVRLLEARIPHLVGHSQAVGEVAAGTAEAMGLSAKDVKEIRIAGLLHDIGMIALPERDVDTARPSSHYEKGEVETHCRLAQEILQPFPHLGRVAEYVLLHHERWNGSGYPNGLREDRIPLGAQVVGLADAYQRLVEGRPGQDPQSPSEALDTLRGTEGSWFSTRVLEGFAEALPELA